MFCSGAISPRLHILRLRCTVRDFATGDLNHGISFELDPPRHPSWAIISILAKISRYWCFVPSLNLYNELELETIFPLKPITYSLGKLCS
jgi:hypothetical protein